MSRSWDTERYNQPNSQPTSNQIEFIQELCDNLNLEYALYRPYTFDEASETIDELTHETDYAHSQSRYNDYD